MLHFDYFARKLEGTLSPKVFIGSFGTATETPIPIELHPVAKRDAAASPPGPAIVGDWEITVKSPKGESAWTLRVSASGNQPPVKAVILRIDGDTGGLYGSFDAAV